MSWVNDQQISYLTILIICCSYSNSYKSVTVTTSYLLPVKHEAF